MRKGEGKVIRSEKKRREKRWKNERQRTSDEGWYKSNRTAWREVTEMAEEKSSR